MIDYTMIQNCGGKTLPDGTLEMRDANDGAGHRYQYRVAAAVAQQRMLPEVGDYDPPAAWRPMGGATSGPIGQWLTAMMEDAAETVRLMIGRRHRISRQEMCDILRRLEAIGWPVGDNGYAISPEDDAPRKWAQMARGIQVVCVGRSMRDGCVRYDAPGSMHPMQRGDIIFASSELESLDHDQIGQLRDRATRVLIVDADSDLDADSNLDATEAWRVAAMSNVDLMAARKAARKARREWRSENGYGAMPKPLTESLYVLNAEVDRRKLDRD